MDNMHLPVPFKLFFFWGGGISRVQAPKIYRCVFRQAPPQRMLERRTNVAGKGRMDLHEMLAATLRQRTPDTPVFVQRRHTDTQHRRVTPTTDEQAADNLAPSTPLVAADCSGPPPLSVVSAWA